MRTYTGSMALGILVSMCFFSGPAQAQRWTTYTVDEGLADNEIGSILEDRQGNLWFGTKWGRVSRYDGTWQSFDLLEGYQFQTGSWGIRGMVEDRHGDLWFATEHGVVRYDGKNWTTYLEEDGLAGPRVFALLEDSQQVMWFATSDGVSRFDGETWRTFTSADGLVADWIWSIYEDRQGRLWFGGTNGVTRLDGETFTSFTVDDGVPLYGEVLDMLVDRRGAMWFTTTVAALRLDEDGWTMYSMLDNEQEDIAGLIINQLMEDSAGNLWFVSTAGVSRYDGMTWTIYTSSDGLANDWSSAILEDGAGGLWFGTEGGVTRYDETWLTYTMEDGLAQNAVSAVLEDGTGQLWVATAEGVSRFDGSTWMTYLDGNYISGMARDQAGDMWFGGSGIGLIRYDGEEWIRYTAADGYLVNDRIRELMVDRAGNLWVATDGGTTRFDGHTWTTFTREDGAIGNKANALLEDSSGRIWLGTTDGLSCLDGDGWTSHTAADGLAEDVVFALEEGPHGDIWVGTMGGGVSRFDGESWSTYTVGSGLEHNVVTAIHRDRLGTLWIGTMGGGVSRYDGTWVTYSVEDGLVHQQIWGIGEDGEGNLWFATLGGLSRYRTDRVPPTTFIAEGPDDVIGVARAFFQYGGGDTYSPGEGVQFSYALMDHRDEPGSADWSYTGLTSLLTHPVPDGTYTLHVRAHDRAGNVDPTPARWTYTVDLTPPTLIITEPLNNQVVDGLVEVRGSALDNSVTPDFREYVLEYARGRSEEDISPEQWQQGHIAASTELVLDGLLGTWDTTELLGPYLLRLRATDDFDHLSKYTVQVNAVTAVKEIDLHQGGRVAAADQVELYVPPGALVEATQVQIVELAAEDVDLPLEAGARLVGRAFDLNPAIDLLKPATLSIYLRPGDVDAAGDPERLAIFHRAGDGIWRRSGGTLQADRITTAIRQLGRYAVVEDLESAGGGASIRAVSCQPRVFQPGGGGYDLSTTISFDLGARSGVTVKIYDTERRFVRRLVHDQLMNRGANTVVWDGTDRGGGVVLSGLYVVAIEAGGKLATQTVAVLNR